MKFAEKYPTEAKVATIIGKFGSWFAIKQNALTDRAGRRAEGERRERVTPILERLLETLQELDPEMLTEDHRELLRRIEQAARDMSNKANQAVAA